MVGEILARRLFLDIGEGEDAAHAGADRDRGEEADIVEAVIDRHLQVRRHQHDVERHAAEQRQGQEAMRDRAAEHGLGGRFRVDMDELPVLGHVGEGVDPRLVDGDPVGRADLGADAGV